MGDQNKSKAIGNIIFLMTIITYLTYLYIDVSRLKSPLDKTTINYGYYFFMILASINIFKSIKVLIKDGLSKNDVNILRFIRDRKTVLSLMMLLYIVSIKHIGFYVSSMGFFIIVSYYLKNRSYKTLIISPMVILTIIYIFFTVLLGVTLPKALLF